MNIRVLAVCTTALGRRTVERIKDIHWSSKPGSIPGARSNNSINPHPSLPLNPLSSSGAGAVLFNRHVAELVDAIKTRPYRGALTIDAKQRGPGLGNEGTTRTESAQAHIHAGSSPAMPTFFHGLHSTLTGCAALFFGVPK